MDHNFASGPSLLGLGRVDEDRTVPLHDFGTSVGSSAPHALFHHQPGLIDETQSYGRLPLTLTRLNTPHPLTLVNNPFTEMSQPQPFWRDYRYNPPSTHPFPSPTGSSSSGGSVPSVETISPGVLIGYEDTSFEDFINFGAEDDDNAGHEGEFAPQLPCGPFAPEHNKVVIKSEPQSPIAPPLHASSLDSPVTALLSDIADIPPATSVSDESESESKFSAYEPPVAATPVTKKKTTTIARHTVGQPPHKRGSSVRTGERRMKQNRSAQKKYREKNKNLAMLRATFNRDALVLVRQVQRGSTTAAQAMQKLARWGRRFVADMNKTCPTTGALLEQEVEQALGK